MHVRLNTRSVNLPACESDHGYPLLYPSSDTQYQFEGELCVSELYHFLMNTYCKVYCVSQLAFESFFLFYVSVRSDTDGVCPDSGDSLANENVFKDNYITSPSYMRHRMATLHRQFTIQPYQEEGFYEAIQKCSR